MAAIISNSRVRALRRLADLLSAAIQDVMQADEAGYKTLITFWKSDTGAKSIDYLSEFNALVMEATSLLSEVKSTVPLSVPKATSEPKSSKLSRGSRLGRRSRVDTGDVDANPDPAPPSFVGEDETSSITRDVPRDAIEETFRHANTMISTLFVSILKAANAQKQQVVAFGESSDGAGNGIVNSVLKSMIRSVKTILSSSSSSGSTSGASLRSSVSKLANAFGQLDACLLTSSVRILPLPLDGCLMGVPA
jgi:hypothetical protein